PEDMAPHLIDWRKRMRGYALAVVMPENTESVAAVVRWCVEHRVAMVPQGGNTGLSGGSVPDQSGRSIVLSLARMKSIRALDPVNNTVTVEAGCVLKQVQEAAQAAGKLFPLSLAAEGSCTIGGNLSTNAGGVQVLRYGNARELCLGLEVVTADGEIWNGLRGLRKDNTGYDLRDLFIGAEGTLGIITAAVLKLYPEPAARRCALIGLDSTEKALALLALAQSRIADVLTGFELLSEFCIELVTRHFPACRRPLQGKHRWYVLLELSSAQNDADAAHLLEALLGEAIEQGLAEDAAMSESLAQFKAIWALREYVSEAQAAEGKNIKHDISVPISEIPRFIRQTDEALQQAHPGIRMVCFGHLGDGNLHYNVSPPETMQGEAHEDAFLKLQPSINQITHDAVAACGGSVSAEHGLGTLRRDEAARYKSAVELRLMRRIKKALDPLGLLNPGKVLKPFETLEKEAP
ncbi:MAG: FAD-binding oxidoreductase, partial [Betaproteobacteria bacterium]|nr:FAD-binding oxidoreductase [Betaproteobacteria bacterium]